MQLPEQSNNKDTSLSKGVYRRGKVIARDVKPWTTTVHSLLRHLDDVGFTAAPRVVDSGFDASGREIITYIDGEFAHPGPWTIEGITAVGQLLRELHNATAYYNPPSDAVWQPWFGRILGSNTQIISHCDLAPWNIVARNGLPVAFIDWEYAGPVDPLVELAQVCWLNVKLHNDDVAKRDGLPSLEERAKQLRALVDAYGLPMRQRRNFVNLIIEFVVHDTVEQADEAKITPDTTDFDINALGFNPLWAMAWRARAAAWIIRNYSSLRNALL